MEWSGGIAAGVVWWSGMVKLCVGVMLWSSVVDCRCGVM